MTLVVDIEKKLSNFSLRVNMTADCEILALLGASGCGKSMTLKCIAGIEKPDRGHIELDGRVLFDSEKKINLAPQERRVGYLFQQYALFPNMTVRKNIACGLRNTKQIRKTAEQVRNEPEWIRNKPDQIRNKPEWKDGSGILPGGSHAAEKNEKEEKIAEIIRQMHLEGLEDKYPAQISGGEQQRTALARILVNAPEVLLLDEPFSALDTHLRFRLERELRETLRQFGKPVLLVSHDRDEVYRMADRIAVLKAGSMEALGTKHEVFADPRTVDGARLTGCKNISRIRETGEGQIFAEDWGITLRVNGQTEGKQYAGIRMHDLHILKTEGTEGNYTKESNTKESNTKESNTKETCPGMQQGSEMEDCTEDSCAENQFVCRVDEEIENPFSYTIMIRPREAEADRTPIGIELDKKTWREMDHEELTVCFPKEIILLLR